MLRATLFFTISAVLSVITLFPKSEHSFDYILILPVGIYFLAAFFLTFRPKAGWGPLIQFSGLSLLIWTILFGVSYNLLFLFVAPVAGGVGAWLICFMSQKLLHISLKKITPVVITGVVATIIGIAFMIAVKNLPKETFTIGLKTGVIAALWQLGVGVQLARNQLTLLSQPPDQTP